jgi:maltose alpha-D-glucosyltransferase/alpha-amylase
MQSYIPNEGDAWGYTLDFLGRYLEEVMTHPTVKAPPIPQKHLLSLQIEPPSLAKETIGSYMVSAQLLGQRTAELHIALASGLQNADFAPEPFTAMYQTSLYQSLRGSAIRTLQLLREHLRRLPEECREDARKVTEQEKDIIERTPDTDGRKNAERICCHATTTMGQGHTQGLWIIDFEGEPARSLSERRFKRSPLRDVAGMLRSFHYAAHSAIKKRTSAPAEAGDDALPLMQRWAQYWYTWVSAVFLNSYLKVMSPTGLLPEDPGQMKILLDAFMLEKALYEVSYELNNRPDWAKAPLLGILQLLEEEK